MKKIKKSIKITTLSLNTSTKNLPDGLYESFARAINESLGSSDLGKLGIEAEDVQYLYNTLKKGAIKVKGSYFIDGITYEVSIDGLCVSKSGFAMASIKWKPAKSVTLYWNSSSASNQKALARYCLALATLNQDVWTDLAADVIAGNFGALLNNLLDKTWLKNFQKRIQNVIPDGDTIADAASLYKQLKNDYNSLCSAIKKNTGIDVKVKAFNDTSNKLQALLGTRKSQIDLPENTDLPKYTVAKNGVIVLNYGYSGTFDLTKYYRQEKDINASSVQKSLTVYGDDRDNVIKGGRSYNYLYGGEGNDLLLGGSGNDTFYTEGQDVIVYGNEDWGRDIIYRKNGTASILFNGLDSNDVEISQSGSSVVLCKKSDTTQRVTISGWDNNTHDIIYGGVLSQFNRYLASSVPSLQQSESAYKEVFSRAAVAQ